MTLDQKAYALIQHLRALELSKKTYEDRLVLLKETLKKIEEFGEGRKFFLNVYGILLVESSYEEAKKQIEDEISLLEGRIAKLEKQIAEIRNKLGINA